MTLLDKAIISLSEEDVQKVADQKDTFNNEKLYGYAMRDLSEIEVSVRVLRLRLGTKDDLAEIEKEFRRIYESLYGVQSMDKGKDGAPSASAGKTPRGLPLAKRNVRSRAVRLDRERYPTSGLSPI